MLYVMSRAVLLGGFYGYISDGVDPETGELMYRDLNNDGKISSSDRTYIGDPNPDFTYGMTNTFSWKGFNLVSLSKVLMETIFIMLHVLKRKVCMMVRISRPVY